MIWYLLQPPGTTDQQLGLSLTNNIFQITYFHLLKTSNTPLLPHMLPLPQNKTTITQTSATNMNGNITTANYSVKRLDDEYHRI